MPTQNTRRKLLTTLYRGSQKLAAGATVTSLTKPANRRPGRYKRADEPAKKKKKKETHQPNSRDFLDPEAAGALADFLTPSHWGATRAGKATQLAEASGQDPGLSVRYPVTTQALGMLGGAGAGLLGGGLAGAGLGAALGGGVDHAVLGGGLGAGLGTVGGSVLGWLLMAHLRRKKIREIAEKFDQHVGEGGEVSPKDPYYDSVISALTPFGGPHRAGQADVYAALKRGRRHDPRDDNLRHLGYAAQHLTGPYASAALGLGMGWGQSFGAADRIRRANEDYQQLLKGKADA